METTEQTTASHHRQFRTHWKRSTADSNVTLYGFRRFKTSHLLNLRFLESEIAQLDHQIYQAGLRLGCEPAPLDRLGLKHATKDQSSPHSDWTVNDDVILRLRDLLKQYDEALAAFNDLMTMETFSLIDDETNFGPHNDLNLYEIYKTRLVRVDMGPRLRQDHFIRGLHGLLRHLRYWTLSRRGRMGNNGHWSHQNTTLIAEVVGRFILATMTAIFFVVPLAILSNVPGRGFQLTVISICVVLFSFLVIVLLKVSNLEMMIVSAAYTAILSVFISNLPQKAT